MIRARRDTGNRGIDLIALWQNGVVRILVFILGGAVLFFTVRLWSSYLWVFIHVPILDSYSQQGWF